MFASERLQKIRQMTLEYKRVDVTRLSKIFGVSVVTIRKDLEQLEQEGFLIRTYGGAVLNEGSAVIDSAVEPADPEDQAKKQKIGTVVSQMVDTGELIYLGAGTTCTEVARALKLKSLLTVITCNLSAAMELSLNSGIHVIMTGGNVIRRGNSVAEASSAISAALQGRYVDKAILSADGISFKTGYSQQHDQLSNTYRYVLDNCDEKIICTTSNKFNRNAFSSYALIDGIDTIVTDEAAPEEYLKYYFENKIRVFNTYDIDRLG